MKIADFKRIITPQIGCKLAGYDLNDVSNSIADDLYMTSLCVDDDKRKVLIISFDLLGLDGLYIQKMRRICADIIQVPEAHVMFTCTHTHSGPETRTMAAYPEQLNKEYLDWLEKEIISAVSSLNQTVFTECTTSAGKWTKPPRARTVSVYAIWKARTVKAGKDPTSDLWNTTAQRTTT